jgi:hypothetical protein
MNEAQDELKPFTAVQLLDAGIWREIGSNEPQPPEAFIEALSRLLARDARPFPSSRDGNFDHAL